MKRDNGFLFDMPRDGPLTLINFPLFNQPYLSFRVSPVVMVLGAKILPNPLLKPRPIRTVLSEIRFESMEPLLLLFKLFEIQTEVFFVLRIINGFRNVRFVE